jgi:hypothetical protein
MWVRVMPVVCAAAYSKPLAAALGDRVPLETERGYHLMISDPESMPRIQTVHRAPRRMWSMPLVTGM